MRLKAIVLVLALATGLAGLAATFQVFYALFRSAGNYSDTAPGLSVVLYTTLVAPTRIAIGGGLIGAGETLLRPLREGVHARLTFQREPEIVAAVHTLMTSTSTVAVWLAVSSPEAEPGQ